MNDNRILTTEDEDRPKSRLMRVPIETYDKLAASAKLDRRHMNQQMAILVDEALEAREGKAREEKRRRGEM